MSRSSRPTSTMTSYTCREPPCIKSSTMRFKTQNTYLHPHRFNTLAHSPPRKMDVRPYNHWVVAGFIIIHVVLLCWILSISIALQRDRHARLVGRKLTQRPIRTKRAEFPWKDALRETEAVADDGVEPLLPTSPRGTGWGSGSRRTSWKHNDEWGEDAFA